MKNQPKLVLASASPARRQLLQNAGIVPIVRPSQFDEATITETDPIRLVETLAFRKAQVVAQQCTAEYTAASPSADDPGILVLGCDSVLAMSGQIYGKPQDEAEAIARWQRMRGQTGELITGHALIRVQPFVQSATQPSLEPQHLIQHRSTTVAFANSNDREINAYIATGEPMNCAGCFTLEGRGSAFIEAITGCYSNVLGLSMPLLRQMLATMGCDFTTFWVK